MTLLKFKGKIYQWTGIFLAEKEEKEFVNSLCPVIKNNEESLDLEIGSWHVNNGFYTYFYIGDRRFRVVKTLSRRLGYRLGDLWKLVKKTLR